MLGRNIDARVQTGISSFALAASITSITTDGIQKKPRGRGVGPDPPGRHGLRITLPTLHSSVKIY